MNFEINNNECVCKNGFYFNQTSQTCTDCTINFPGCLTCSESSICYVCDESANFIADGIACRCAPGFYFDDDTLVCLPCTNDFDGCLRCEEGTCFSCDTENNFIPSGFSCVCAEGYYLSGGNCLECSVGCLACLTGTGICSDCD